MPPAPPECARLVRQAAVPPQASCPSPEQTLAALDEAVAQSDPNERDARLARLQACDIGGKRLLLALRADLGPLECADSIIGKLDESGGPSDEVRDALKGLGLAAQLSRLVRDPPLAQPPHTKDRIGAFIRDTMSRWVTEQAQAIQSLALEGSKLSSYGKAIAAVEAGLADIRFVEAFRSVPLPEEYAGDAELTEAYYASLDEALEPRKVRGRDAALVGLRMMADLGVLRDPRVSRARQLLSQVFNGRRIDALDGLLLPPLTRHDPVTVEQRLAARLPTFYAARLLQGLDTKDPAALTALLGQGLPPFVRGLTAPADLTPPARLLLARGWFDLGRTYWRADDFAQSRALLASAQGGGLEAKLLGALARALEQGPKDAAQMMLSGPMPRGLGAVSELDALARGPVSVAGFAAYDAAFLLELAPPPDQAPQFFEDLAARYRRAAKLLPDPNHKAMAVERADAAEATAKAVR